MPPAPEDKHQINHHKAESQETDPFLSETEKGSYVKRFPISNKYLIFLLLCAYFESQIFWTRPWHSLVWYFNAFKVAGCLRVYVCVHGRMIFRVALMQILSQPASPSNIQPNSSHWILKTLCTAGKLGSHICVNFSYLCSRQLIAYMQFQKWKGTGLMTFQSQYPFCSSSWFRKNWVP